MRKEAAVRREVLPRDLPVCGLFAALIAVGAFIKIVIPVGPDTMNITLQWFFVLLAAFLLGARRACFSVAVYLLIGLMGVPVFARGGGPAYLLRPTFGFLLGFLAAAGVTGFFCERLHSFKMSSLLMAAAAGYLVYYGAGIGYFYLISRFLMAEPVGIGVIIFVYCLPEMPADILFCIFAAALARRLRPAVFSMLGK